MAARKQSAAPGASSPKGGALVSATVVYGLNWRSEDYAAGSTVELPKAQYDALLEQGQVEPIEG